MRCTRCQDDPCTCPYFTENAADEFVIVKCIQCDVRIRFKLDNAAGQQPLCKWCQAGDTRYVRPY
jgi:hypothetical protein